MSESIHFDDLTTYSHYIAPFTLSGVKNIGWLDLKSKYTMGDVPKLTLQKLKELANGTGDFDPIVETVRELPSCQVCGELRILKSAGDLFPNSELWLPGHDVIYASPIAILHFIETHNYLPPSEFINAINNIDINTHLNSDKIYREKLQQSEWNKLSGVEKMNFTPNYNK